MGNIFSDFMDDQLGLDPNGGGIYNTARDVLGDTIADDILGMDPSGGGAIDAYNVAIPLALGYGGFEALGGASALGMEGMGIAGTALGENALMAMPGALEGLSGSAISSGALKGLGGAALSNAVGQAASGAGIGSSSKGVTNEQKTSTSTSSINKQTLSPEQQKLLESVIGSQVGNIQGTNPQQQVEDLLRSIVPGLVESAAQQYIPQYNARASAAGVSGSSAADSALGVNMGNTISRELDKIIGTSAPQFYQTQNQQLEALSGLFQRLQNANQKTTTRETETGNTAGSTGRDIGDEIASATVDAGIQYALENILGLG